MPQVILIVFMTTALTTAVRDFSNLSPVDRHWYQWWIMGYFVITKIQFFHGDVNLTDRLPRLESAGITWRRRAVSYFSGVASLFMFLLVAFSITDPARFFLWQAVALVLDVIWVWNTRATIDPNNDVASPTTRTMLSWWIGLDLVGFGVCAGLFWVWNSFLARETVRLLTGIGLGVLTFDKFVDYAWYRDFYFGRQASVATTLSGPSTPAPPAPS